MHTDIWHSILFCFVFCFFSRVVILGGIKHLDKLALKLEYKQTVEPILREQFDFLCVSFLLLSLLPAPRGHTGQL